MKKNNNGKYKLTEQQLRKVIKEGVMRALDEQYGIQGNMPVLKLIQMLQQFPKDAHVYYHDRNTGKYLGLFNVSDLGNGKIIVLE